MKLETHGRWPVVGAAALAPVTAAAIRRPSLRPLAALLWHQTEEWVWPGSFLPWVNRQVLGSRDDEFPINRRTAFVINVVLGWGGSLAAMDAPAAATPASLLYTSHFGNVALHAVWAARHRRYDPGVVTAFLTLLPVAASGLRELARDSRATDQAIGAGVVGGLLASAALVPVMKWRLRRAQ
jgi:Protein of unknown function with HXXEE motif